MYEGREILAYYCIKHQGKWDEIYDAINRKEKIDDEEFFKIIRNIKSPYISMLDEEYPEYLKWTYKPPFVLFYYGDISLIKNYNNILAVVGSRECSPEGETKTYEIVSKLAQKYIVISGMALGIDAIAHHAIIDSGGKTIAVLGSGIDYPYPFTNIDLYKEIKKNHLIISEYSGSFVPEPACFPFRNRLISALSWGVFCPELKAQSGSLSTIGHSLGQGRSVMVLPQEACNGTYNNRLIREGAILVENAEDILEEKWF